MRLLILSACLLITLHAQPLRVFPMQSTDLDEMVRNLRNKKPIPAADCASLDLWECNLDELHPVTDLSMHWMQLDEDPELEAVLVIKSNVPTVAYDHLGYIFDKQRAWNLVGSFSEKSYWHSTGSDLIQVLKLTENSPVMVLVNVDLGGTGSVILTTQMFQLREGKLWPVMQITGKAEAFMPPPYIRRQHVFSSSSDRLIIHSISEEPPGRVVKNECEVRRWDPVEHTFPVIPNEKNDYCDPKTGKPINGKSFATGVPVYP
jgi:hypothetical protein